jgi:hypothetical protein
MQADRLRLEPYAPAQAERWDRFVRAGKNGTFLLERGFMDYHADRFADASLMAFDGADDLVAVLPAAQVADEAGAWLSSHPGLTYGGWVTDARMTAGAMLRLFELLAEHGRAARLAGLRYKAVPACYHRLPADEDLYALFVNGARLARQDLTSVIALADAPAWAKGRTHSLSKARRSGVEVAQSGDYADFHACLSEALAAHGASPVHSVAELELLATRFPDRIRLYAARLDGQAVAYVWSFDTGQTAHTQYMAARPAGRDVGALDAIVARLQFEDYADRRYLSFGISTEDGGRVLNRGLVAQKEMFGGRAMICPAFEWEFGSGA